MEHPQKDFNKTYYGSMPFIPYATLRETCINGSAFEHFSRNMTLGERTTGFIVDTHPALCTKCNGMTWHWLLHRYGLVLPKENLHDIGNVTLIYFWIKVLDGYYKQNATNLWNETDYSVSSTIKISDPFVQMVFKNSMVRRLYVAYSRLKIYEEMIPDGTPSILITTLIFYYLFVYIVCLYGSFYHQTPMKNKVDQVDQLFLLDIIKASKQNIDSNGYNVDDSPLFLQRIAQLQELIPFSTEDFDRLEYPGVDTFDYFGAILCYIALENMKEFDKTEFKVKTYLHQNIVDLIKQELSANILNPNLIDKHVEYNFYLGFRHPHDFIVLPNDFQLLGGKAFILDMCLKSPVMKEQRNYVNAQQRANYMKTQEDYHNMSKALLFNTFRERLLHHKSIISIKDNFNQMLRELDRRLQLEPILNRHPMVRLLILSDIIMNDDTPFSERDIEYVEFIRSIHIRDVPDVKNYGKRRSKKKTSYK
jgi:hypothetical protein